MAFRRSICALPHRRRSCPGSITTTGYDEDAVDEGRLVLQSSAGPARRRRRLVAEVEDFAQEFGRRAGELDFDRGRGAGEGVAEDGFFHCVKSK